MPRLHLQTFRGLVGLCWIWAALVTIHAASAATSAPGSSRSPYAEWPAAAHRTLNELAALAGGLVERAASAKAPASQFRIDTVYFRETLRELMLANRERPPADQLSIAFLNEMVRMAALLNAAAECQSGRHIVCPADLMDRLRRQHAKVAQGLRSVTGES